MYITKMATPVIMRPKTLEPVQKAKTGQNADMSECPWCGQVTRFIHKRAHIECGSCHRPVADCCDGEQQCYLA